MQEPAPWTALLKCCEFAGNTVENRILYRRGVEGAAPYSGKGSKISTNHEEIVERFRASAHYNHKKISTVHEKNVEKITI